MITRWTFNRKAELVEAIRAGAERDLMLAHYRISEEELASWEKLYAQDGKTGLRSTKLGDYRRRPAVPG